MVLGNFYADLNGKIIKQLTSENGYDAEEQFEVRLFLHQQEQVI